MKRKYLFVSLLAVAMLAGVAWALTFIQALDLPGTHQTVTYDIVLSANTQYLLKADPDANMFPGDALTKWSCTKPNDQPLFTDIEINKPSPYLYVFTTGDAGTYHFSGHESTSYVFA